MTRRVLPVFVSVLALWGCTVGPDYQPPVANAPEAWIGGTAVRDSGEVLKSWWDQFNDPVLSRLIQQAIDGNYDLKIATQRIRAAQDAVQVAASADLPHVGLDSALESRRQTQTVNWPPASPHYGIYPYYQLGFDASWELDVFGGTARRKEAARAANEAAVEYRREVLISLSAGVAMNYAAYRAAEVRLQIANESLEVAQRTERLARRAFSTGQQSHLGVSEAEAHVHAVEAEIPTLEGQADILSHAIAILLGKMPEEFDQNQLQGDSRIPIPPPLPLSLPSEVISRRPDIGQAERDVAQSNALVGAAVADLYPKFSIPLSIAPTTSQFRNAFHAASLLWRMGLDGSQSLYSGGKLTAQVDAAVAGRDASLLAYRLTVLKAFAEVEDALTNQIAEKKQYEALSGEVTASQVALNEAQGQYRGGQVGYLPVLDSERELYAAKDAQAISALSQCLSSISLFKALGGGWEDVKLPDVGQADGRNTDPTSTKPPP